MDIVLGTIFPILAIPSADRPLSHVVLCLRSTESFCAMASSGSSLVTTDGDTDPTDEIEECRLEGGLADSLIASCSLIVSGRLNLLKSPFSFGEDSPSGPEFLLPGIIVGHEQPNSFREQPPQIGRTSSHFFFRRLQVQQPVRTRTMRVVLVCRSGGIFLALAGMEEGWKESTRYQRDWN